MEAAVVFEEIGDRSSAAEVDINLADLLIDQGKPADAAVLARRATDEFEREKAPRDESLAYAVLSRSLLAQGNRSDANKAIEGALALSEKYHDREVELSVAVIASRVRAAAAAPPIEPEPPLACSRFSTMPQKPDL